MANKKKSRDKVNWGNPKVKTLISYIQLGENRVSKNEILSIATKDIFYQLKNSGFLEENGKDNYVGTSKLHRHIKNKDGTHFSSSGSSEHAKQVRDTLGLLPSSVLQRKAFMSSYDIEAAFNKNVLKGQGYKETLKSQMDKLERCLLTLESSYSIGLERCKSDYERSNLTLSYLKEKEQYESQLSYLHDKPYLIPDYQVTLSQEEREEYVSNLESYCDTLNEHSKAFALCAVAIDKINSLPPGGITLDIEVATNTYGNREIFLHENYECFSGTPQIIIM